MYDKTVVHLIYGGHPFRDDLVPADGWPVIDCRNAEAQCPVASLVGLHAVRCKQTLGELGALLVALGTFGLNKIVREFRVSTRCRERD